MRIAVLMVFVALVVAGSAWLVRGRYDRIYLLEGRFMVVNVSPEEQDIRVRFPSGISHQQRIPGGGSHTFRVRDTGEGGVSVFLGDTEITGKNGCGYVTSINSPQVLVVQDDKATMHHYSTSPKVESIDVGDSAR